MQVIIGGYAHQIFYVRVDIQHDLVLSHALGEGSDGRDLVHSHYEIRTLEQPCIGSLNASDDWREMLIVTNQPLNTYFV